MVTARPTGKCFLEARPVLFSHGAVEQEVYTGVEDDCTVTHNTQDPLLLLVVSSAYLLQQVLDKMWSLAEDVNHHN